MKKEYRIKSNLDFSSIIKSGKRLKFKEYNLYYIDSILEHYRFGISVSTKLGNAVKRNRIKRQVRSMIDDFTKNHFVKLDVIVVVKEGYLNNDYQTNKSVLVKNLEIITHE